MDQGTDVGQQEEAGGLAVEAADGGDGRVALIPAWREEVIDRGAFAGIVGADRSGGLVEHDQQAVRRLDGLAVDPDRVGIDPFGGIAQCDAVPGHAPGLEPARGFASRAMAIAGEQLIHAKAGGGHAISVEEVRGVRGAKPPSPLVGVRGCLVDCADD